MSLPPVRHVQALDALTVVRCRYQIASSLFTVLLKEPCRLRITLNISPTN